MNKLPFQGAVWLGLVLPKVVTLGLNKLGFQPAKNKQYTNLNTELMVKLKKAIGLKAQLTSTRRRSLGFEEQIVN